MTDPFVVVVLAVLILTILVVRVAVRVAKRRLDDAGRADLGSHVIVGVARPNTALPLARLAAALAVPVRGHVEPLSVHPPTLSPGGRSRAEHTLKQCADVVRAEGVSCDPRLRIDQSVDQGILHSLAEQYASALVIGWPTGGGGRYAKAIEQVLAVAPTPVLLVRADGYRWNRVILRVPQEPQLPGLRASLRCASQVAERVAAGLGLEVTVVPRSAAVPTAADQLVVTPVAPDSRSLSAELDAAASTGDVLLSLCHGVSVESGATWAPSVDALYRATVDPIQVGRRGSMRTG